MSPFAFFFGEYLSKPRKKLPNVTSVLLCQKKQPEEKKKEKLKGK